jgi:hypothetical protein
MTKRFLTLCLMLFLAARLCAQSVTVAQNSASVGAYNVYELTLTHDDAAYANVWTSVTVWAQFINTTVACTLNIPGFYYDIDTWKVRFAPPETGMWTWTLSFDIGSGVVARNGSFTCTASTRKGFIKRHPFNPYRMVYADGSLYDGIGLENCQNVNLTYSIDGTSNHSVDEYADTFANAGFNLYRWTIDNCSYKMWDTILVNGNRYRVAEGKAGDRLVQTLWQNDFRIYLGVFGFTVPYATCAWNYGTYFNVDQQNAVKHYLTYMMARYGAYTDIWEMMNECAGRTDWINMMTAYVRAIDPYHRMITTSWEMAPLASIDIGSPHLYCYWEPTKCDSAVIAQASYGFKKQKSLARKPVIYGEFGNYPMNWDSTSALRMRIQAWTAFFYEVSLIYWETSYAKTCNCNNIYIGADEWPVIRSLTRFTGHVHQDVVMCSLAQTTAGIRSYGLQGGNMLLGYFHHFTSHTQNTTAALTVNMPGAGRLFWYDPLTGDTLAQQNVTAGSQTLTSPAFKIDCALKVLLSIGEFSAIRDRMAIALPAPEFQIHSDLAGHMVKISGGPDRALGQVLMHNAAGTTVRHLFTIRNTAEINTAGLAGGVYFVEINGAAAGKVVVVP